MIKATQINSSDVVENFILVNSLSDFPNLIPFEDSHRIGFHKNANPTELVVKLKRDLLIKVAEGKATKLLDEVAKSKGYDSILSAVSYASIPGPYHAEGVSFATWRQSFWHRFYELFEALPEGGEFEATTIDNVFQMLPKFELMAQF